MFIAKKDKQKSMINDYQWVNISCNRAYQWSRISKILMVTNFSKYAEFLF